MQSLRRCRAGADADADADAEQVQESRCRDGAEVVQRGVPEVLQSR